MCICKVVQLLLGLQIEHLDGLVMKTPKRWTCCRSTPQLSILLPMKEDEWRGRRKERKNDGTGMCICKVVQLLLGLQIEHLDGVVMKTPKRWTCCRSTPQLSLHPPMKEDEWRGRRKERKNDGTLMCICKVVQLLLGLQIEHLDGVVPRPRNDEPVVARHRNWPVLCLWKRMSGGVEERKERMMVRWCASAKWCSCCLVCRSNTLMDLSSDPETMNLLSLDTATDHTAPMKEDEWRGRRKERKKEWWYLDVHLQSGAVAAWSADRTPWWTCLQTPKRWTCCRSTPQLSILPLWKRMMSGGVEERKERMMVLVCASAKWCSCCLVCRSNTLMDLSWRPRNDEPVVARHRNWP